MVVVKYDTTYIYKHLSYLELSYMYCLAKFFGKKMCLLFLIIPLNCLQYVFLAASEVAILPGEASSFVDDTAKAGGREFSAPLGLCTRGIYLLYDIFFDSFRPLQLTILYISFVKYV